MYGDSPPAIVIVGHREQHWLHWFICRRFLSNRMQHFLTVEKAIEWSVKGGSLRNIESAHVSIPSTLIYDDSKKCYTHRAKLEETEQYWRGCYKFFFLCMLIFSEWTGMKAFRKFFVMSCTKTLAFGRD